MTGSILKSSRVGYAGRLGVRSPRRRSVATLSSSRRRRSSSGWAVNGGRAAALLNRSLDCHPESGRPESTAAVFPARSSIGRVPNSKVGTNWWRQELVRHQRFEPPDGGEQPRVRSARIVRRADEEVSAETGSPPGVRRVVDSVDVRSRHRGVDEAGESHVPAVGTIRLDAASMQAGALGPTRGHGRPRKALVPDRNRPSERGADAARPEPMVGCWRRDRPGDHDLVARAPSLGSVRAKS